MPRQASRSIPAVAGALLAAGLLGAGSNPPTTPAAPAQSTAATATDTAAFERDVRPLLKQYCYECHDETGSGGLEMDSFKTVADLRAGKKEWEKVIRYTRSHVMPPADADLLPDNAAREQLVRGVVKYLYGLEDGHVDPGRVVVRRLNRVEYRNSVRDLLGISFDPTTDFPEDDTGYGFDNIGDVLTLPPMLMEKYLAAAGRIAEATVPSAPEHILKRQAFPGEGQILSSRDELPAGVTLDPPGVGEYRVRILASAAPEKSTTRPVDDSVTLSLMVGDVVAREFQITPGPARWYDARVAIAPGDGHVRARVRRLRGPAPDHVVKDGHIGQQQGGAVALKEMTVEGPVPGGIESAAAAALSVSSDGASRADNNVALISNAGQASAIFPVDHAGEYLVHVAACASFTDDAPVQMQIAVDGHRAATIDVRAPAAYQGKAQGLTARARRAVPTVYTTRVHLDPGRRAVSLRMLNDAYLQNSTDPQYKDRNLYIRYVELEDPDAPPTAPAIAGPIASLVAKFAGPTVADGQSDLSADRARTAARNILSDFARRAWRRPVSPDELAGVMRLYDLGQADAGGFRGGLRQALTGVLVSPSFLMRGVPTAAEQSQPAVHPVGEYELAERLSYFLWSSTPDDELLSLAAKGQLRKNLPAQVKRMLASPKAQSLSEQFGGQWLQFRNLDAAHPDHKMFEAYNDSIRDLMKTETQTFFASLVNDDRSVLDLLTADYTFLNEKLADYYGIPGVKGDAFRKVSLQATQRRGVLTQGSVLTITSNPTRTSPVKRGKWVLENLLGAEPPPPPPNLPTLEGAKITTGTLRQRLERHRADPTCAACHAAMDPIGLGLENFDAVGRWRDTDAGEKIDAQSAFPGGKPFVGAPQLVAILAKDRRDDVLRAAADKMLTFAIGRGVEGPDEPAVDKIVDTLRKHDGRFSSLIMGVVDSAPFQLRRGTEKQISTASAMAR